MSDRLERAIQILVLLQSRVQYNTLQLAQELGVHRRTIFRDIAALRAVGIPIQVDTESGSYSLIHASPVPLESVNDAELTELIVAVAFSPLAAGASGLVARRAMLKLLRRLPRSLREQAVRIIRAAVPGGSAKSKPVRPALIDGVLESIRKRLVLEVVAEDPAQGLVKFGFQPQRFSFDLAGGTAVGRTHPELRSAVVDLSLVRDLRLTETPFVESRPESRSEPSRPEIRMTKSPSDRS